MKKVGEVAQKLQQKPEPRVLKASGVLPWLCPWCHHPHGPWARSFGMVVNPSFSLPSHAWSITESPSPRSVSSSLCLLPLLHGSWVGGVGWWEILFSHCMVQRNAKRWTLLGHLLDALHYARWFKCISFHFHKLPGR